MKSVDKYFKKWGSICRIFKSKRKPIHHHSTLLQFAEDYHKEINKKELKQVFDAYGIGFMYKAQFKHDFESWYEMESKNF